MLKVFNEGHANDPAPDSRAQQRLSAGVPREELLSTLLSHFSEIGQLEKRLADSNPAFNRILLGHDKMAESALAIALGSPNEAVRKLVREYTQSGREKESGLPLYRMNAQELGLLIAAAATYSQQLRQRAFPEATLKPSPSAPPPPSLGGWSPDGNVTPNSRRSDSNRNAEHPSDCGDASQPKASVADLRQQLEAATSQLDAITKNNIALELKKAALEQRLLRAQEEIRDQKHASKQQEGSLTAARQMLELTRSERDQATTRSSKLAEQIEQLLKKLEERDSRIEALESIAGPQAKALRNARTTAKRIAKENEMLKQSCAQLDVQLSRTLSELLQRDALIESLRQQLLKKADGETARVTQVTDVNDSSIPRAEPAADLTESAPSDLPAPKKKINSQGNEPGVAPTEAKVEPVTEDSQPKHEVALESAPPAQPKIDEALGQERDSPASLSADSHDQDSIELRGPNINIFEHLKQYGRDDGFTIPLTRTHPDFQPTTALPGSAEKIEVLRRRLERRQELWHPDDGPEAPTAKFDDKDVA